MFFLQITHIIFILLCLSRPQILDSIGIVEYAMVGERNEKFFSPDSAVSSSDKFDASK